MLIKVFSVLNLLCEAARTEKSISSLDSNNVSRETLFVHNFPTTTFMFHVKHFPQDVVSTIRETFRITL